MVSTQQGLSLSQSRSAAPFSILALDWRCTHDIFLYLVFLLVFLCAVQSVQIKSIPPGQKWPGFSFALHRHGAGLLFCPAVYKPRTSVYSALCIIHAQLQTKRKNRLQGFTEAFPLIWPAPAHTIQQIHKPTIHHLRHTGGHTIKRSTSTDTR
nr:MAG TPA: hypothetical protein [Siphoviridae sp. cthBp9]